MVARSFVAAGNKSLRPGSGACLVSDLTYGSTAPSSSRSHRRLASAVRLQARSPRRSSSTTLPP